MAASRLKGSWEMQSFPGWPCAQLKVLLPSKMEKKKQNKIDKQEASINI